MASSRTKKCSTCEEWKNRETEFSKHKSIPDGLRSQCKVCCSAYDKKRREDPAVRKRQAEYLKAYRQTEAAKKKRRIAEKARVLNDWEKLKKNLGSALNKFAKGRDTPHNRELFGCTRAEFRTHIESKFEDWMNPENRGRNTGIPKKTWQFDHIIPYAAFPGDELEKHKKIVCWYKNVRPLCALKNNEERADFVEDDKQALIRRYQLEEIEFEVLALL